VGISDEMGWWGEMVGRTNAADGEGESEPEFCAEHGARVEEGEDGEEEGEDYGERERGDIGPEVDYIFVELEFGHLGWLWGVVWLREVICSKRREMIDVSRPLERVEVTLR
jgi:hypothetical protein